MKHPALDLHRALRWLRGEGHRVGFRRVGYWDCLIESGDERWLGSGISRRAAFEHALSLAFPSRASRELLAVRLDALPIQAATSPELTRRILPALVSAKLDSPAVSGRPSRRIVPRVSLEEAAERFQDLEGSLRVALESASLLCVERQRLLLLSWVAHARNIEEAAGETRQARESGQRIMTWSRTLSKIWWPGTLRALDTQAAPADASIDLPADTKVALENWGDVAAAAEDALVRMEIEDSARGLDADGWADAAFLEPAPSDADGLLREAVAHIEAATTRLLRPSEGGTNAPWLFEWAKHPTLKATPALGWVDLASRLRWLRGHAVDTELWAAAFGRVRCVVERLPTHERDEVARILDRHFDAGRPWAQRLGLDPERKALQRQRRELLSRAPIPSWSDDELIHWIREAIKLKDLMTSQRIAEALVPMRARVKELVPETIVEFGRRDKRRLRDIQEALATTAFPLREATRIDEPAIEVDVVADDTDDVIDRDVLAAILEFTRGKNALVVSNRNDPDQDAEIERILQLTTVDHGLIDPRRIEALTERVERGSYDLVLAATGFMPHKADGSLRRACAKARIPYVRMNRGRPRACLRHLARDLGLSQRVR